MEAHLFSQRYHQMMSKKHALPNSTIAPYRVPYLTFYSATGVAPPPLDPRDMYRGRSQRMAGSQIMRSYISLAQTLRLYRRVSVGSARAHVYRRRYRAGWCLDAFYQPLGCISCYR